MDYPAALRYLYSFTDLERTPGTPRAAGLAADAPELGALTTYEIVTGMALRYFAQERVDWAVLEIGLGGRLDAVNAVRAPRLSVITSLSMDHMKVLGNTIAEIAYEKAG